MGSVVAPAGYHSAGKGGAVGVNESVRIEGLAGFRRALKKIDKDVDRELKVAMRTVTNTVRDRARTNAPIRSGALRKSIRTSVTNKRAAIYSNVEYAAIQEYGGQVGNGAIVERAKASHYMRRAVAESRGEGEAIWEAILDSIERTWRD